MNRERKLLYVLIALIIGVLLYLFVFKPQQEKIAELNGSIENNEVLIESITVAHTSINRIKDEIDVLNAEIDLGLSKYFKDLTQSDALAIIDYYTEDTTGVVKAVNFSEGVPKKDFHGTFPLPEGYSVINASIVFGGDYEELMSYIENFYQFEEKIFCSLIEITTNEDTLEIETTFRLSLVSVDSDYITHRPIFEWDDYDYFPIDPFNIIENKNLKDNYEFIR